MHESCDCYSFLPRQFLEYAIGSETQKEPNGLTVLKKEKSEFR